MFRFFSKEFFNSSNISKHTFSKKILTAYEEQEKPKNLKIEDKIPSKKYKSQQEKLELTNRIPILLSIGGGKGGIGKSFITANVATRLALCGFKVAAVDLDLGASNLHSCLGMRAPKHCISDFLQGRTSNLEDTGVPGGLRNLTLFAGNQDFFEKSIPDGTQRIKLIHELHKLEYDYILLDLGAGTHAHTLDFFIFSDVGLLVITPEPTSIENAYVFMKSILYRKIQNICSAFHIDIQKEEDILDRISNCGHTLLTPFATLCQYSNDEKNIDFNFSELIQATNIGIIMNQVRTTEDKELGESMSNICDKYFGFCAKFLGQLRYDDSVWRSIRSQRPLIYDYPNSIASSGISRIVDEIVKKYTIKRDQPEGLSSSKSAG